MKFQRYIGIMSGTSMDGSDAVLIKMNGNQWLGAESHAFTPYSGRLKKNLIELQNTGSNELHRSKMLAQELSTIYAQTVSDLLHQTNLQPIDITAIGCHGQTVRHAPEHGYSIQLADLPLLAEHTGIFTIGDFRSRDLAAGGQGAPLVPAFHEALFSSTHENRVVLNIGGISNISVLSGKTTFGFDTGPGNMLMDAWTMHIWHQPYDKDGNHARSGKILSELLNRLLSHSYFELKPPKSTGRELFSLPWLLNHLNTDIAPNDVLRTLVEYTAITIRDAVLKYAPDTQHIYVCGGGICNLFLMERLQALFQSHQISLHSTTELNLNPQWVEAAAFGWLAACWVNKITSSPHHATGANKANILGAGYFA